MIADVDPEDVLGQRWRFIQARATPWDPEPVRMVVVAPHPDDETLMAGGLIATQRIRDVAVTIIAVTDGDAAYPGVVDKPDLAAIRRLEQDHAVAALGVEPGDVIRLGVPDGGVAAAEKTVAEAIADVAAWDTVVVAPWAKDHHSDHEAAGRAAVRAARAVGARLIAGFFWTWHHREPRDLSGLPLRCVDLGVPALERRAAALACHRSQVTTDLVTPALLQGSDLAPMRWPAEYFLDLPQDRS